MEIIETILIETIMHKTVQITITKTIIAVVVVEIVVAVVGTIFIAITEMLWMRKTTRPRRANESGRKFQLNQNKNSQHISLESNFSHNNSRKIFKMNLNYSDYIEISTNFVSNRAYIYVGRFTSGYLCNETK